MQLKNKTVAIMQPTFMPWIGYFSMINKSDVFVFFDDVQVVKRSWQTRNRIKTPNGEYFITVPVKKGNSRALIKDCQIAIDNKWKENTLNTIEQNYSKTKFYNEGIGFIKEILVKKYDTLSDLNCHIIKDVCEKLQLKTELIYSSNLSSSGKREKYLCNICEELGAKTYLSAPASRKYIEESPDVFGESGIEIKYHNYVHPIYNQKYGDFISHLCVLDAIFNIGYKKTRELII